MKSYVRSLLTALLLAASTLAFSIGVLAPVLPLYVGRPDLERRQQLSWPAKPVLQLRNNQGVVTVEVNPARKDRIAASVAIRGYEREAGHEKDAEDYVARMMHVEEAGNVVRVTAEPEERPDYMDFQVDLRVSVPPGTSIQVDNGYGNVSVRGACADVSIQGRYTDIMVDRPKGAVQATSTNGRIQVFGASGDTRLETVNGSIFAHMNGGSLLATTINGAIVAHVLRPDVRYCELNAQNGGITLVLNKGCTAFVEAKTERGVVRCDYAVDTSHGVRKRKHLEGNIGAGRVYISMDTLNGNVWIRQERAER